MSDVLDFAAVALLGALVGAAELVSRYRDAPHSALVTPAALLYVALNLAASCLALALIHGFQWTFGATGGSLRWTQILVAGIGAMALFRTSLFTVRAGQTDIGVGPGSFLQIFRDAADRQVDRARAHARGAIVAKMMDGLEYRKASEGLIPYCLALMQNVPGDQQKTLTEAVNLLNEAKIDDPIKVRILGLHLLSLVGPDVLSAAVESLRDQMKAAAATA